MLLAVLLLPLCYFALLALTFELFTRSGNAFSRRDGYLFAAVSWAAVLVVITEGLSLFQSIAPVALSLSWLVFLLLSLGLYFYLHWRRTGVYFSSVFSSVKNILKCKIPPLSWLPFTMVGIIFFQAFTLAMVAYRYPPNNVDSMTYHLARVMHWQQQQSVIDFATNIDRQIQLEPFAEFVLLHLQVLFGGDKLANLVQWFAMLLSLAGISDIARKLGAGGLTQLTAALLTISIPMGILQSTSTQNDYVVAAWLVCFISFGLSWTTETKNKRLWAVGAGLALGLALLTKATAYLYALPFVLLFGILIVLKLHWRGIVSGTAVGVLALLLNLGHFTRNTMLYGSPLGPTGDYANQLFTPQALMSNLIRNITLQFLPGEGGSFLTTINRYLQSWLRLLHEFTGLSVTDPRTTWDQANVFLLKASYTENGTSSSIHTLLIMLTLLICVIRPSRTNRLTKFYMLALTVGFVGFSFYLMWESAGSRLQLPLLVLWSAAIAIVLFPANTPRLLFLIPVAIALFSLIWTFDNKMRPITSEAPYSTLTSATTRADLYPTFPLSTTDYRKMTDLILNSGCSKIGLSIGENTSEYPLWVRLQENHFQGIISHINVNNPSRIYSLPNFQPCAVIAETNRLPLRPTPCNSLDFQSCAVPLKDINTDYEKHFFAEKIGDSFYVYLDLKYAVRPTEVSAGFVMPISLSVSLGPGWYSFEPNQNSRWMQTPSLMWVYSEHATTARLSLTPSDMKPNGPNPGPNQGSGNLKITVNDLPITTLAVQTDHLSETEIPLKQGFNTVQLELSTGNFTPGPADKRLLSIAFRSIQLSVTP